MKQQDLDKIIVAGISAPSADNSQPWQYQITADHLNLWIDSTRSGSISDTRFVLSDLALGTTIENMVIQAADLGYDFKISYFPEPETKPLLLAKITWQPCNSHHSDLASVIHRRHTNRSFPWKGNVSRTTKTRLQKEAENDSNTSLLFIEEKRLKRESIRLMRLAESLRFQSKLLHKELFSSIHFHLGWKEIGKEGLSPATLAVEPPMKPLFPQLRHWKVISILNKIHLYKTLGFRVAALPTILSPTLALLCTKTTDRVAIIETGRALARVWLKATIENIALQPFAAAGIYSLGFLKIEPELQSTLEKISKMMEGISEGNQGLIFLRMGITQKSSPYQHGRRSPNSFLKQL